MSLDAPEFLLGINYFPRRKGITWWQRFDRGEVRDEFAQVAGWGLRGVRIFLTWHDFQPGEEKIDHRALDALGVVLRAAADYQLQVLLTLFAGPLDGAFFYPAWCYDPLPVRPPVRYISLGRTLRHGALKPIFTAPRWQQAQRRLLRELVGFFGQHQAVWGWDLGPWADQLPLGLSRSAWEEWLGAMGEQVAELSPGRTRTWGLGQRALTRAFPIPIDGLAALLDRVALSVFTLADPSDPLDLGPARFALSLARALGSGPLLIHAAGLPTVAPGARGEVRPDHFWHAARWLYVASEDEQAAFIDDLLYAAFRGGAAGLFLWRYADYAAALYEVPPYDQVLWARSAGLVRADGSDKPAVQRVQAFASALAQGDLGAAGSDLHAVEVDAEQYYRSPKTEFARLLQAYREGSI